MITEKSESKHCMQENLLLRANQIEGNQMHVYETWIIVNKIHAPTKTCMHHTGEDSGSCKLGTHTVLSTLSPKKYRGVGELSGSPKKENTQSLAVFNTKT